MNLTEICIRRPVFATVLSLVIAAGRPHVLQPPVGARIPEDRRAGGLGDHRLYAAPRAEIIESQVTQPLEELLSGIEGIDVMSSQSRAEQQPDHRALPHRPRPGRRPPPTCATGSSRARDRLPDEIDEPVIAKVEADAQPIIYLALSSRPASPLEVTDYADRFVKDRLQNLPGVAECGSSASARYAMRIWLDRLRLAAYGLTPQDVEDALRRQNVEIPAGRIESAAARVHGPRRDRPAHARAVRRPDHPRRGRLSGAAQATSAEAEIGALDERTITRFKGNRRRHRRRQAGDRQSARGLRSGARDAAADRAEVLPEGMKLDVAYDTSSSSPVDRQRVPHHRRGDRAGRAGDLRLPAQPARDAHPDRHDPGLADRRVRAHVDVRLHDQHADAAGMVLAIGLVVDDAIVMLENICRHVEDGHAAGQGRASAARARSASRSIAMTHHAGRGLRADRLPDRPHRAAVHRVRAGRWPARCWSRASWR